MNLFDVTYYILLFIAIYFQVFFLVVFFEKRKFIEEEIVHPEDVDLPSVSFLIPCWNEANSAVATVESVLGLDYPEEKLKIFLIDDGSTDNTWEIIQCFANHPHITLLQKENGGKHTALNYALTHVTTDFVASFDADTTIDSKALKNAVVHFLYDPKLMALGGAVLIDTPKTAAQYAQSIEYQMFSFTKKILGLMGGVLVVPGAFSMFRKEVFDKIGGYRKAHNLEDLELTFRMHAYGMKVDHCHTALVKTKGPSSVRGLFKQRLRWSYGFLSNIVDYFKLIFSKKYGHFSMFTLPMTIFTYFLVIFVFFVGALRSISFIIDKIREISLVGFKSFSFSFDFFFVDTRVIVLLSFVTYMTVLLSIYMGKRITGQNSASIRSFFWFATIYTFVAPMWVLKSLYSWIFARQVTWR